MTAAGERREQSSLASAKGDADASGAFERDASGSGECAAERAALLQEVSAARLGRVRAALADEGLDAFLVRDTSNIRWLTAFDGVFDEERAHALLVLPDCAVLHTDSRYAAACERAAAQAGGVVEIDPSRVSHASFASALLTKRGCIPSSPSGEKDIPSVVLSERSESKDPARHQQGKLAALGIEDDIALREYRALEKELPSVALHETSNLVQGLRAVKDADEVARLLAAQAVTDAAFRHITGFMRLGMTEREVQRELEGFMLANGAEGLAFPSIVATGENAANPHAIPGDSRLEAGQCVVLDFGAKVQGYCADMTRTVFLGQPSDKMLAAYAAVRAANERVEALLAAGMTGKAAHELAEQALEEGGFGGRMGHSLGHGVGLDVHEDPALSPRNDKPLQPGNVVTVEPGVYLPGEFGMRLEDFGVITPDGYQVFTQSTHEMVIIDRLL